MRAFILAVAFALCAGGCTTSAPMAEQQPTLRNIQLLRTADTPSMALGEFGLAPGLPPRMDRSIQVRADTLKAPGDGSFAHYLRETLAAELRGAGKLDSSAPVAISGLLTQSEVSTGSPSHGTLGARFSVMRGGVRIYDKELSITQQWPSSFIGAIAIPEAMNRYTGLYPALVSALLNDPDFRAALKTP